MRQAKCGDRIKVHYTGKLENGAVFDASKDGEPFEFTIGEGEVIPGFEKGVIGMEVGETKTITVPPEEAYGPRNEELIVDVKKSILPENIGNVQKCLHGLTCRLCRMNKPVSQKVGIDAFSVVTGGRAPFFRGLSVGETAAPPKAENVGGGKNPPRISR